MASDKFVKNASVALSAQSSHRQIWFAARCCARLLPAIVTPHSSAFSERRALFAVRALSLAVSYSTQENPGDSAFQRAADELSKMSNDFAFWPAPNDESEWNQQAAGKATEVAFDTISKMILNFQRPLDDVTRILISTDNATKQDTSLNIAFVHGSPVLDDLNKDDLWPKIWAVNNPPDFWPRFSSQILEAKDTEGHWTFWINWYRDLMDGRLPDPDLMTRISLEIPNEDWNSGPARVAERIREIEENRTQSKVSESKLRPEKVNQSTAQAVAIRVASNRDAIALTAASLLEQVVEYREHVRSSNWLDPTLRDELISFLDDLHAKLSQLLSSLPSNPEAEAVDGSKFAQWHQEFFALIPGEVSKYIAPENVAQATIPAGIILGCTGVGALVGGPFGGGIGAYVAKLITNQIKPGKAVEQLLNSAEN
ncbi:MAG: hypothetical protein ABJQ34_13990 [Paracoccaceae bacterium]